MNATTPAAPAAAAGIYTRLVAAGIELDSHESDLYVAWSEEASAIIRAWREETTRTHNWRSQVSTFRDSQGKTWYELPFMNEPWWTAREQARRPSRCDDCERSYGPHGRCRCGGSK